MDILSPELVWVEDRCYRFFESSAWSNIRNVTPYVEDNFEIDYEDDESCDTNITIVPAGASKYKHTFHVAKPFFPFIIGSKRAVQKRLETETKTTIQVPKLGEDGDIVITGSTHRGIITARRRIDLLLEATRKKFYHTHFVSIPLHDGHIIMKFNEFKSDVLANFEKTSRGVEKTIFQTPSKLHLTIVMLKLLDDFERRQAVEALEYCKEHIINPLLGNYEQIRVRLEGIDVMNSNPAAARVLYANVIDVDGVLQELSDKVAQYYCSIGLGEANDTVKLHVTLMNMRFKSKNEEQKKWTNDTFDATEILKAYKNTFFGEVAIKQFHISQISTIGSDGYYQASAKINLIGDQ